MRKSTSLQRLSRKCVQKKFSLGPVGLDHFSEHQQLRTFARAESTSPLPHAATRAHTSLLPEDLGYAPPTSSRCKSIWAGASGMDIGTVFFTEYLCYTRAGVRTRAHAHSSSARARHLAWPPQYRVEIPSVSGLICVGSGWQLAAAKVLKRHFRVYHWGKRYVSCMPIGNYM